MNQRKMFLGSHLGKPAGKLHDTEHLLSLKSVDYDLMAVGKMSKRTIC